MNIADLLNVKELLNNEKYRHFIRFAIVGVINTCVDFAIYSSCIGLLGIHYIISYIIGFTGGVTNSFIFNKYWTFGNTDARKKTTHQFIQFMTVSLVALGITLIGMKLLVDGWGINKYIAKLITIIIAQSINYFGYKLWVFKKDKTNQA